jgi:alkylated DNA repair dioxygenase AlkB
VPPPPVNQQSFDMSSSSAPQILVHDAARGGLARYWPSLIPAHRLDALLQTLRDDTPWVQETTTMYGKTTVAKRKSAAYADHPGLRYNYGGANHEVRGWTAALLELRDMADAAAGVAAPSNYAVLNYYKDGQDMIGMHSDKERDLVRGAPILSVSLGAARDFVLKPNATFHQHDARTLVSVELASGSLLSMEGTLQSHYKHGLPVRKRCKQPRINITFRRVKEPVARGTKRARDSSDVGPASKRAKRES